MCRAPKTILDGVGFRLDPPSTVPGPDLKGEENEGDLGN